MFKFQNIPYNWRKFISYSLVALASSVLTTVLLIVFGSSTVINYSSTGNYDQGMLKLQEVYNIIQEQYIGEADEEAMIDAAAQALVLATGDQWSYYMNAEEYAYYKQITGNSYEGIGVTVDDSQMEKGFLITGVEPEGGAAAAGIQIGDYITHVEGKAVHNMATSEAQGMIRGQAGTKVKLTINRNGTSMDLEVSRGITTTTVATGQLLEGNVGLVTIVNFNERCYQETVAAIESLKNQGATSLIFDVRNNPGGYKSELVEVLDYLLPKDKELFRSELYNGVKEVDRSKKDQQCDLPVVVLINADSYSAAEFFAAALVEYDRAITVGEHTTGKGYFQTNIELSDGSAVHLSIGKFSTPNGVNLAEVGGIAPTHEVKLTKEQAEALAAGTLAPKDDPQIQKAVAELLK